MFLYSPNLCYNFPYLMSLSLYFLIETCYEMLIQKLKDTSLQLTEQVFLQVSSFQVMLHEKIITSTVFMQ